MYKILTELGQGAFGHVYLLQTPNFEKYALKITKRKNLKEAEIMKYLCHAHLVKCFDFIAKSLHLYLVIEYCSQGTLNDLVKQQQKHIPEKILLKMLCQLSDVLRYLCAKNVIHRDLKPDNIFLDKHKNIKVGDVGVARVLEHTSEEVSTVVGAWLYMSPEMHAGKKYTFKTDIWSLGCCMHELMTLQRTFFSLKDLFERRIPALPQDVYSKRLCCLILKMLEEEPDERPDAYEILFKTSEIRSKRYEPGDLETKLDIKLDFREVIMAVTEFTENTVSSSVSVEESHTCDSFKDDTDSKETVVHRPKVAKTNRHSAGSNASGSSKLFENLQRDTFGTITNKKAQRRLSSGHSVSEDSATPTWGSDSFLQENSSESSLNPLHRRSFPKISELPEADQSQKETCRPKEKVTGSTSKSRGKQDSKDGSLNELVKSTLNVFAEQTDSLKELMVKRATGDQSYKVDGEAMLNHQPF